MPMHYHDKNTLAMIGAITSRLHKLKPEYVRKVLLYSTSLLNIQDEQRMEVKNHD